jgi:hypothetical protein
MKIITTVKLSDGTAVAVRDLAGEALAEVRAAERLDTDRFDDLLLQAGRVHGPALLFDAWYGKKINSETLTAVIGDVWSVAEYPELALGRRTWLELFDAAGYTADGKPAERPSDVLTLYRGAPHSLRRRMSWTARLDVAVRFASERLRSRLPGIVWVADVPPDRLLMFDNGREEQEYVIDTRGLKITALEGAPA